MLNRTSKDARQCRRCKQAEPHVRFAPLSFRLCLECQAEQKAKRGRVNAINATLNATRPGSRAGSNAAHLDWVRSLPCSAGGRRCHTAIHAHHVRTGTGGGTGMKPADRWAVPLCAIHHSELHTGGHATFEARYGLNLRAVAADLARFSPHLERHAA